MRGRVAEKLVGNTARASGLDIANRDADESERGAAGRCQAARIIEQAPDDLTPDGASAEDGDAQRSRPRGTRL